MRVTGRISFRDAGGRRAAETQVHGLVDAGLPVGSVRVDGLTLVLECDAEDTPALRSSLRALAASAWGGAITCTTETSPVPETLYAGGPDARGIRALGSLAPIAHASRFRGELARAGGKQDKAGYVFARSDCKVLVFYALSASHDRPDEDDPRWVYGTPPAGVGLLSAQAAPVSRIVRRAELLQALNEGIANEALDPWAAVHLGECLAWAAETGCRWFAYMLEPFELAGDGTAARVAEEAESQGAQSAAVSPIASTMAASSIGTPARTAAPSPAAPVAAAPPAAPEGIPPTRVGDDEISSSLRQAAQAAPSAPVAPVASAVPVAPVAPLAPTPVQAAPPAVSPAPAAPAVAAPPRPAAVTAPAQAAVPAPTSATFLPPISPVSLPTALEGGAFGAHRSALLRALSRGIGQNGLHVARRAADYTQQCGDPDAAIMDLVALAKDAMSQPVTRGDALFAIAVLGVEHGRALPELAFAPLLDATLRTMTMDHERRPGFEGLLRLAPRTAAYDALRVQLGLA